MQNVCKFFKPSAVLLGSLWSAYLIGFQHNEKYLDFSKREETNFQFGIVETS